MGQYFLQETLLVILKSNLCLYQQNCLKLAMRVDCSGCMDGSCAAVNVHRTVHALIHAINSFATVSYKTYWVYTHTYYIFNCITSKSSNPWICRMLQTILVLSP